MFAYINIFLLKYLNIIYLILFSLITSSLAFTCISLDYSKFQNIIAQFSCHSLNSFFPFIYFKINQLYDFYLLLFGFLEVVKLIFL